MVLCISRTFSLFLFLCQHCGNWCSQKDFSFCSFWYWVDTCMKIQFNCAITVAKLFYFFFWMGMGWTQTENKKKNNMKGPLTFFLHSFCSIALLSWSVCTPFFLSHLKSIDLKLQQKIPYHQRKNGNGFIFWVVSPTAKN